jgi:hypothetical protein
VPAKVPTGIRMSLKPSISRSESIALEYLPRSINSCVILFYFQREQ